MVLKFLKVFSILIILLFVTVEEVYSQQRSTKDLSFLIGVWHVREDNKENGWWEESKRTGRYVLDSTYIELESLALDSKGKKRIYRWYIHYNSNTDKYEMTSFYSNWPKVESDILNWDSDKRKLTIRNKKDSKSYHERYGEIVFDKKFNEYIWIGENKYGDPDNPSVWNYVEKGVRIR